MKRQLLLCWPKRLALPPAPVFVPFYYGSFSVSDLPKCPQCGDPTFARGEPCFTCSGLEVNRRYRLHSGGAR